MAVEFIKGDLLLNRVNAQAIGHGCNCMGAFDAGVAGQIGEKWPMVKDEYIKACNSRSAQVGKVLPMKLTSGLWIINMFTQVFPGRFALDRYVESAMIEATLFLDKQNVTTLAVPMIGAGIGGLSVRCVDDIMERVGRGWDKGKLFVYKQYVANT